MKIYPLRKGYKAPAPPEVAQAVRNVIADWDGLNWVAVRHCIETTMPNATGLDDWTIDDIRQRFAIGQRKMTIELGGRVNTTDATIVPTRFATIDVGKSGPTKGPVRAYPQPLLFGRDQFIWQNICTMSVRLLIQELKIQKNFGLADTVTTAKGFRDAALRYSRYHREPTRTFRSETPYTPTDTD